MPFARYAAMPLRALRRFMMLLMLPRYASAFRRADKLLRVYDAAPCATGVALLMLRDKAPLVTCHGYAMPCCYADAALICAMILLIC